MRNNLIFFTNQRVKIFVASTNISASCYQLGTQENSVGQSIYRQDTFQCKCLPHVTGLNCDQCEDGYYNILSGKGCLNCQCNEKGTMADQNCDYQGKCTCKEGFKG